MDEAADNFDLATVGPYPRADDDARDDLLAASICAGEREAFEQLFDRHRRRVARIAGRFFNRPERIEEIIQETFTKVYFAICDYSPERGRSFAAWLSRIAINACYDELRRAQRRPESPISEITDDELTWLNTRLRVEATGRDAESRVVSRDLADKLLARLSAEDRLVLTLLEVEGLSINEISDAVGWSVSKVKVRAHRARQQLRAVVSEFV
jgi:RNA polymerase sigma-70 factor (ECF subfamily)